MLFFICLIIIQDFSSICNTFRNIYYFFSKNIIMNQILENKKFKKFNKKIYLIQFLIFFCIISCIIVNLLYSKFSKKNSQKVSETTSKSYSLSRLYSSVPNTAIKAEDNIISIIGNIEIPKLEISYPIFSQCSDELLKISVCKFYGPNIGENGNLCIAGHNYDNDTFFSKLFLLKVQDTINIYDIYNNKFIYSIYNIYEINPSDMSYLSQNTSRKKRNYSSYLQ